MANAWSATPYGYAPVYWVSIAGFPFVPIERALGLTLPTDIDSEDGCLVIDDSAEVGVDAIDRDRGIGSGLDLTLKLLDTSTVRDYMRRWDLSATLTADLTATATTISVDDTSGWPSTGELHIGLERITYGGKTGTSFTSCTRATANSLANAYTVGTTGQIVTNRPRFWRGREVVLWATMVSPSGHCSASALDGDDSVMLWRGRIAAGPDREPDGFVLRCQSLDRYLDAQLAGKITGKVDDTSTKFAVNPAYSTTVRVIAETSTGSGGTVFEWVIEISPFASYDPGQLISGQQRRVASETAWTAAVSAAGASGDLGSLIHKQDTKGNYYAYVTVVANSSIKFLLWATDSSLGYQKISLGTAGLANDYFIKLWPEVGDGGVPDNSTSFSVGAILDSGDPADAPATGKVMLSTGDVTCTYKYNLREASGARLYISNMTPLQGQTPLTAGQVKGAEIEVMAVDDDDTWDQLALRCLHSSGTGQRSGTYDTLPKGYGYGIDESAVDSASFVARLGSGAVGNLRGRASIAGKSFVDLFGGVLGLFRLAVVARPDSNGTIKLHVVETGGSSAYLTTITDADLLSYAGDPVVSIKRAERPNSVIVEVDGDNSSTEPVRMIYNDQPDIDALGKVEVTYNIDAMDRDALADSARIATVGSFAHDATLQAVELIVHPSVEAYPGDAVWLTTVHPALWTWSTNPGRSGYDGPGRVTGRRLAPKSGHAVLTVLIDGATRVHALSPAAEVVAYDDPTTPTQIDVSTLYTAHMQKAIEESGSSVRMYHYQPGRAEGVSEWYVISAAGETGGVCRLTVDSIGGTPTLDTTKRSTLTLPPTATATTYQAHFAHADDGTYWG